MSRCIPHPDYLARKIRRILSQECNFLVRFVMKSITDNEMGDEMFYPSAHLLVHHLTNTMRPKVISKNLQVHVSRTF